MNPRSLTLDVPFVVIMILVVLAAGGKSIVPTQMAAARSTDNNSTAASLENPFFVEKGRIIGQRVLSVNPLQIEFTVAAYAIINQNIMRQIQVLLLVPFNLMEYSTPKDKDL